MWALNDVPARIILVFSDGALGCFQIPKATPEKGSATKL